METLATMARVRIDPKTISQAERPLTKLDHLALRKQRVIDFIRSRPLGSPISPQELQRVTRYSNITSVHTLMTKMEAEGIIEKEKLAARKTTYRVLDQSEVKVVKQARPREEPKSEKPLIETIETLAMEYYWKEDNNNLRQFIDWVKAKEQK